MGGGEKTGRGCIGVEECAQDTPRRSGGLILPGADGFGHALLLGSGRGNGDESRFQAFPPPRDRGRSL